MGSVNKTLVDGVALAPWQPTLLAEGSKVVFGDCESTFSVEQQRAKRPQQQQQSDGERPQKQQRTDAGDPPQRVRCLHLLVKHRESRRPSSWRQEGPIERTKAEARQTLEGLRARIVAGEAAFEDLARQLSDCSSARKGGDLGLFGRRTMQKPFEDAAFALAVGEMSGIVETDSGLHIIKRVE
eukprot:m51a1_g10020 putative peptidyl-prolyl cis-trans isomerase nima-interacting 1 (183) ;mRNA; r:73369-74033